MVEMRGFEPLTAALRSVDNTFQKSLNSWDLSIKSTVYAVCKVFQLFNFIFLQSTFGNVLVTEFEKCYAVKHLIKKQYFGI